MIGLRTLIKHLLFRKIPVQKIPLLYGELLKGGYYIVTGGSRGIGLAIAKSIVRNKGNVVIVSRNKEQIEKVVKELKEENINSIVDGISIDMNNLDSMRKGFEQIIEIIPKDYRLNGLVNCAGISTGSNFGETKESDFDKVLGTNLKGTYFFSQLFSNYLKKYKYEGHILNVDSTSSMRPAKSPYACSKWAINGLTKGMAQMLLPYGITVNGIAPGQTYTDLINNNRLDNIIEETNSPIGRYLDPDEIANVAVILLSDIGKMIIGDTVYVNGGCAMCVNDDVNLL